MRRTVRRALGLILAVALPLAGSAQPTQPQVRGVLQSAATANGNGNTLNVQIADYGFQVVTYVVSGTFSATVNFEATVNTTTRVPLMCYPVNGGAGVTITTSTGAWRCNLGGTFFQVRARISGYSSGSVTVTAVASYAGLARHGEAPLTDLVAATTQTATGVPSISSGTWSVGATLAPSLGGTGLNTATATGVPSISSGTWSVLPASLFGQVRLTYVSATSVGLVPYNGNLIRINGVL